MIYVSRHDRSQSSIPRPERETCSGYVQPKRNVDQPTYRLLKPRDTADTQGSRKWVIATS
eukprot:COSAG03_NODE_1716_length_3607_cov_2.382269_3_plen_60_part_00